MARVRVIIWDDVNLMDRISNPEDTFLIESIDASDDIIDTITIGPISASEIMLGRTGIKVFVSGILSGNYISGTYYGDGSNLRGTIGSLNSFTGSIQIIAGDNISIDSISNVITISAISGSSGSLYLTSGSHRTLDQLVHSIAETSYEEIIYSGTYPSSCIVWLSSSKLTKIREEQYVWNGNKIDTLTTIQYNVSGSEIERIKETYTYSGIKVISIDRELL